MKWLLVLGFVFLLLFSGCTMQFGQNYEHLQDQNPTGLRRVNLEDGTNANVADLENKSSPQDNRTLYEYLNNNLCETQPECCGEFSPQQRYYISVEEQAIADKDIDSCYTLPRNDFVITCGNDYQGNTIVYSRQRCLDSFEEER